MRIIAKQATHVWDHKCPYAIRSCKKRPETPPFVQMSEFGVKRGMPASSCSAKIQRTCEAHNLQSTELRFPLGLGFDKGLGFRGGCFHVGL